MIASKAPFSVYFSCPLLILSEKSLMRVLSNRVHESWAFLPRSNPVNTQLAIFMHGFRGNYLSTWGKLPDLLAINADADAKLALWDFLFLGYNTKSVASYLDISSLIGTQWRAAAAGQPPFGNKYAKLALFGHSLGTLGIRQFLCEWSVHPPAGLAKALHSVTLFGTPLNGSPLAWLAWGYTIREALRPNNPQLRMLKRWAECARNRLPWPAVNVILGLDDLVVGHEYSELVQWVGDAPVNKIQTDHRALVKPDSWNESALVNFIQQAL
jgi:hypothetical protein